MSPYFMRVISIELDIVRLCRAMSGDQCAAMNLQQLTDERIDRSFANVPLLT